eukprot:m.237734 g.237734  ORF g.237734 m.237734 type:complete len:528 (+) comp19378_c0_seq5:71-1654(+)
MFFSMNLVLSLGFVTLISEMAMASDTSGDRMNVVMIAVDDLRPSGTAFGHSEILVPNIDRLAARATVFTQAFVQAATCGVSRSSLLTSRRPDSNYVLSNSVCPFTTAPSHSAWQSLPEYFRASGYKTAGLGKIFHPNTCQGAAVGERQAAWSDSYYHAPCISLGSIYNGTCYESYPGPLPMGKGGKVTSIYANASVDATDDTMPDGMIAQHAVDKLHELSSTSGRDPFFLAVGFHKPHLPHIAPKKYFDLYPLDKIQLPSMEDRQAPRNAPDIAWNDCGEMRTYHDTKESFKGFNRTSPVSDETARAQRQAYYAAASFTDAQIGKVLTAIEDLGLTNSTVIALWGDHGWHLSENNEWAKHTAMTWANRAPLLFAHPRAQPKTSSAYVEFVDIYPTLVDLAGLPPVQQCSTPTMSQDSINCTEGMSLKAQVFDQDPTEKAAAFSQWPKGGSMGYNVFTNTSDGTRVRYTEWVGYKNHTPQWDKLAGRELYNHTADPNENINIVDNPAIAAEVDRLSKILHAGWRKQLV